MSEADRPVVFVVDDDDSVRNSLRWLLESVDLAVETYATAEAFLEAYDRARPGCLVLDIRMPGMSGLDLHEKLQAGALALPVIIITGHADVPMAVRAMKAGAFDFIEKPFNDQVLLERIQDGIARDQEARRAEARRTEVAARVGELTPREREVMDGVVAGRSNKEMASDMGLSVKTVEAHRARVMEKMRAESLSYLVTMVVEWQATKGKP